MESRASSGKGVRRLRRALPVALLVLLLQACLDVQLNGPVINGQVTIATLASPTTVLATTTTRDADAVIGEIGRAKWESNNTLARFLRLGTAPVDAAGFNDGTLYLVTVRAGRDIDANHNLQIDDVEDRVSSPLRAIMTGVQLKNRFNARVSVLTEAVYQWLEPDLAGLSDAQVLARLDQAAALMIVTEEGDADYDDLLAWSRFFGARENYRWNYAQLNRFADALSAGSARSITGSMAVLVVEGDSDGDLRSNAEESDNDADGLDDSRDPAPDIPNIDGRFVDAAVAGLGYVGSTLSSRTDADGGFQALHGEALRFRIGGLTLGNATAGNLLSPLNLFPDAYSARDPRVNGVARVLQTVDEDCEPENGIVIGSDVWRAGRGLRGDLPGSVFELEASPEVATLLDASGCASALVNRELANQRYLAAINAEFEDLLATVSSFDDGAGAVDLFVGGDGSLVDIRRGSPAADEAAQMLFKRGDAVIVIGLGQDYLPLRMSITEADGQTRLVRFTNATAGSVDSYQESTHAGKPDQQDIQRVELTAEAIAAYSALRVLVLGVEGPAAAAVGLGQAQGWLIAARRQLERMFAAAADFLVSPARAGEENEFLYRVAAAVFSRIQSWDGQGRADPSPALGEIAAGNVVRSLSRASLHDLLLYRDPLMATDLALASGLCEAHAAPLSAPGGIDPGVIQPFEDGGTLDPYADYYGESYYYEDPQDSLPDNPPELPDLGEILDPPKPLPLSPEDCRAQIDDSLAPFYNQARRAWNQWNEATILDDIQRQLADPGAMDAPPLARILDPVDGSVLAAGVPITVQAICTDARTTPAALQRQWRLDDRPIGGDSTELALPSLAPGDYRISLDCTDGAGQTATAGVDIRVGVLPEIRGVSVPPLLSLGETAQLSAVVEDGNGNALPAMDVLWFSDLEGIIGMGPEVDFTPSVDGVHQVAVHATNRQGGTARVDRFLDACIICTEAPPDGSYLRFFEGEPEGPGDGLTIRPFGGPRSDHFDLSNPLPLGVYEDGLELSLFTSQAPQVEAVTLRVYDIYSIYDSSCALNLSFPLDMRGDILPLVENGVRGYAVQVAWPLIEAASDILSERGCGSGLTDDLLLTGLRIFTRGGGFATSLDAARVNGDVCFDCGPIPGDYDQFAGSWNIVQQFQNTPETTPECERDSSSSALGNLIVDGEFLYIDTPGLEGVFTSSNTVSFEPQITDGRAPGIDHAGFTLSFSSDNDFMTTMARIESECIHEVYYQGQRAR